MKSFSSYLLPLCAGLALNACVSKSRYTELEGDNQKKQQEISALKTQLGSTSAEKNQLQTSVAEKDQALAELRERRAEADKRIAEFKELTAKFKGLVDAGKLSVKIVNGRMTVGLSTDVLFASGSARLSAEGQKSVKETAQLLASLSPERKFQVEGHTDNVPISTATYPSNWELASARAITVLKAMIEGGLPPERISAASFGETQPVQSNDAPEGRTANRRIAIVILPDLSSLPGFDELQKLSQP